MSDNQPTNPAEPQQPVPMTPEAAPAAPEAAPAAPQIPAAPQEPVAPAAPEAGAPYVAPAAPAYQGAPAYQAAPGYQGAPGYTAPAAVPGKTLGIVGLILSFFGPVSLVGLVLSIVALVQSKKAGAKNTPALVGIIIGGLVLLASIIGLIILIWVGAQGVAAAEACMNGAESVEAFGQILSCEQILASSSSY